MQLSRIGMIPILPLLPYFSIPRLYRLTSSTLSFTTTQSKTQKEEFDVCPRPRHWIGGKRARTRTHITLRPRPRSWIGTASSIQAKDGESRGGVIDVNYNYVQHHDLYNLQLTRRLGAGGSGTHGTVHGARWGKETQVSLFSQRRAQTLSQEHSIAYYILIASFAICFSGGTTVVMFHLCCVLQLR
jgi:hypothetical protein